MKIAVECYPDEAVLCALGVPRKQLLHEARKGEVFNWLKRTPGGVGMVASTSRRERALAARASAAAGSGAAAEGRRGSITASTSPSRVTT